MLLYYSQTAAAELAEAHQNLDQIIDQLIGQAEARVLWRHPEWLKLLHYDGDGESPDDYHSSARDPEFFLTENGRDDPEAELNAMIMAIQQDPGLADMHVRCRFIARYHWLSAQLGIDTASLPAVDCNAYREWRQYIHADLVTMAFPAYHLNSPSSMYGHTLLRLDSADNPGGSKWLSTAISFGADINENDNSLIYTFKGLAGGYSGLFITDYYFKKIQEYNRIEHRDIWEYRLNLTAEETERLVLHLWELQGIGFDYYYFDENCSYRLLELLEVARPGIDLTSEFVITAIPVDTVRAIERNGMIERTSYRPALATSMRYRLQQLAVEYHELVLQLADDIAVLETTEFDALPEATQQQIVDLAYRYLRYRETGKQRDAAAAKRSHQLLLKINSYPGTYSGEVAVPAPYAPETGHGSKRFSIGGGRRLDSNYAELGFKMSYHDLEDNEQGFLRGAQINIGTAQLRIDDDELKLYRLDLADVFSLTPVDRFFDPVSWRVYTGFERQYTRGVDQMTYHVTGGGGRTWNLGDDSMYYLLGIGRLEINAELDRAVEPALGFSTGLLHHFGWSTARLAASGEHFLDDVYRLRLVYTHNFVFSTNHSLKLHGKYEWQENDEFSDVQLGYQYYF